MNPRTRRDLIAVGAGSAAAIFVCAAAARLVPEAYNNLSSKAHDIMAEAVASLPHPGQPSR